MLAMPPEVEVEEEVEVLTAPHHHGPNNKVDEE